MVNIFTTLNGRLQEISAYLLRLDGPAEKAQALKDMGEVYESLVSFFLILIK